jgi:hypothetical protein
MRGSPLVLPQKPLLLPLCYHFEGQPRNLVGPVPQVLSFSTIPHRSTQLVQSSRAQLFLHVYRADTIRQ